MIKSKRADKEDRPVLLFFVQKEKALPVFIFAQHNVKFRDSPSAALYDFINLFIKDPSAFIMPVFFPLADCQTEIIQLHVTDFRFHDSFTDFV